MPWWAPLRRSPSPCSTSTCGFARKVWISTSLPDRPSRALRRPRPLRRGASAPILLLVVAGLLAAFGGSSASASPADDYTNAVHRALTLVQFAERGDLPSIQQAIDVLVQETGRSQPEILRGRRSPRSEEHTSELQSHSDLVCRLLLEKKNTKIQQYHTT